MRPYYYDADSYDTYLEQLGIEYPTVRNQPLSEQEQP
jgi:aminobenzoyl-glutamate utilization protein B